MGSEQVLDVPVRRYIIESERSFPDVLDGIFGGISRPDITSLFGDLEASTSYEQFSSLVRQAQGAAGLMRFWQLNLDVGLTLDPLASHRISRRLVRLIVGNPVTMGEMTRHVADAGSYTATWSSDAGPSPQFSTEHPVGTGRRSPCVLPWSRCKPHQPSG